jgi:hypothetical protein
MTSALRECPGQHSIPDDPTEIRLFSKSRNESLRLPAFLRHYRALGVNRFFIADNGSTDGSTEYLRHQPDVHVFTTDQSFRAAGGGTAWLNELLARFGVGRWCVTVDVDELLWYPGVESTGLSALTEYFTEHGYEAMACLLLDMYPRGSLSACSYAAGDDLVEAAPYFDGGPYTRQPHSQCPYFLVYGGARERIFFPEARSGWSRSLHIALYHRLLFSIPGVKTAPWIVSRKPVFPPCLTKAPLVRWTENSRYLNVNHFVSDKVVAPESGVLLHFKMLQDLHRRAVIEAARGEYFDGAIEFQRYVALLRTDPGVDFHYEGSIRIADSAQLIDLGLLTDTPEWSKARGARDAR